MLLLAYMTCYVCATRRCSEWNVGEMENVTCGCESHTVAGPVSGNTLGARQRALLMADPSSAVAPHPTPHTSRPKRTWRPKQRTLSNSWNSSNQTAKPKLRIVPGSLSVFAVSRSLTKTAAPTKKIWQLPPSNGRLPYTTCGEKKMGSNCDYAHFV